MPKKPTESPEVIAYRVQKLEEAVEHGFVTVNDKLDKLNGFITTEESDKIIEREWNKALVIHKSMEKRIANIEKKSWVHNTLSAILGSVLTFLVLYAANGIIGR